MEWRIKSFKELTVEELYGILHLRNEVFVVEQDCIYQDCDNKDKLAYHLFAIEGEEVIACLRILPQGVSYEEASMGRIVVKKEYRKQGLGIELVKKGMEELQHLLRVTTICISGQAYLLEFYKGLGFKPVSDIYMEDNIPHIKMLYQK